MKNFTENINNLYEENEDINIYLMEFISKNKKEWDNFLKIICNCFKKLRAMMPVLV